jgi:hypothetical protein
MKIHEVLIESQLNEEILTELDWSKIKKGLAAGIISLGALGISSGAMAGDKDGSYEKQLTPAQAMQIIKQKLQQGEIKPAEIKQAVQKVDAAPEIKKAEPKVDVKPEINKSESPFDKLSGKILTQAGDSGKYKIVDVKSVGDEGKWVLSARLNKDNTVTYSTRMFNISSGTEIVQDGRNSASTDTEKNPLAVMKAIWEKGPNLKGKEVKIGNGTIQSMYLDHLKSEFPTAKKEIKKDAPKMSDREAAIEYGTKTAGTMHDLQKLGYSRAQAITELEKFTGSSSGMKQILTIIANMAYAAPKGHYTRSEFINQVKTAMEENLPK